MSQLSGAKKQISIVAVCDQTKNVKFVDEHIRPEDQKTVVLSGEVDDIRYVWYDKVEILNGTVLKAAVISVWEVSV